MTAKPDILDGAEVPFDTARADRLMEEAGIDVLLVTSKHNTRYLLGGYGFIFFSAMDAIGHSRYLPIVIYAKGGPTRPPMWRTVWNGLSMPTGRSGPRPSIRAPGARSTPRRMRSST